MGGDETAAHGDEGGRWEWDETLYAGSAPYYAVGRMPYPVEVADALHGTLHLDGSGRLLDVGCGPGALTLVLAPLFGEVIGIDADGAMIAEARRRAAGVGTHNARWRHMRAEDLPGGLGGCRAVTFAQSFHWVDRLPVARAVLEVLDPGGACVLVHATTHQGVPGHGPLPRPRPPWEAVEELVRAYLGPHARAGRGLRSAAMPGVEDEGAVLERAGFTDGTHLDVGGGEVVERTEDEIVASVFSLSSATPHLFGSRLAAFEGDLRHLLRDVSPGGRFSEVRRSVDVEIWRKPA